MTKDLSLISQLKKAKNNLYQQYQSYIILYEIIQVLEEKEKEIGIKESEV